MTHIIITSDIDSANAYLLSLLSKMEGSEVTDQMLNKTPDIHIFKPQNPSIGIEDIKEIQKDMRYLPYSLKYQYLILYNSHLLTTEAQNAFLKTLEESPQSTIYILLLKDERKLLPTILSRGIKHFVKSGNTIEQEIVKPEILELDLVTQFEKIEEMSKLETSELLLYLSNFQKYLSNELNNDVLKGNDVRRSHHNLEVINNAYQRISSNGNKRMVLENMILQLEI